MLTETRLLAVLLLLAVLPGCAGVRYVSQAAHGQWQLMRARQPIDKVIADPTSSEALKARLQLVKDARTFAATDLKLPDNKSYRSYSDLKRPFVVWNVVATPEFSVTPLHWCFPFVGCLSYRGYFHEKDARQLASVLAGQGNDTLIAGITAYSTLGHFADPVLNTMLRYGDDDLIGTVFHELAHQLIYVKGDTQFNESFAMTVEEEGLQRYLNARGRPLAFDAIVIRHRQEQSIVNAFGAGRQQLALLYAKPLAADEMRAQKQKILQATGDRVLALEHEYRLPLYDLWIEHGLNNAHLASIGTYYDCVPGFRKLLVDDHEDLSTFYAAVRRIGRNPQARRALCSVR
ncbi:MAG TPA: aminopeptidase [Steroidobacteraceae bacterium]|jgi:predicted aminopeptidase|nr:aminopeptidase [Steroidobacteraceae bacterium]